MTFISNRLKEPRKAGSWMATRKSNRQLCTKTREFFKRGKIDMAANKYRKVIDLLEHEISLKGEKEESRRTMLQAGRMNLTMCLLKSGDWIEARDLCEKVLAENENVPKAY